MSEHSTVVGGSTAGRVISCPGSVKRSQNVPEKKASEFADRGTMGHLCIEALLNDPELMLEDLIGKIEYNGHEPDEDYIANKIKPALEWFEDQEFDEFWVEQRVAIEGVEGGFGTADVIYRKGDEAGVVDWKFGDGVPVKAVDNDQMRFYLTGALDTGYLDDAKTIKAHIYQPSAKVGPDEYHNEAEYSAKELADFKLDLQDAIKSAMSDDDELYMGDHCRWCPVNEAAACPLLNAEVGREVQESPKGLPAEELAALLPIAEIAEKWAKQVKALAQEAAKEGATIEGYKLVKSLGNRAYIDPDVADMMLKKIKVPVAERYNKKLISPAQVDKLKLNLPERWEKNIERPDRGLVLVPESDKRKAVQPTKALEDLAKHMKALEMDRG